MTSSMKKTLITGCLILIIAFIVYRFFGIEMTDNQNYIISVILEDAASERWSMLKEGMEQAGKEYNVELEIYTINENDEASVQGEMIEMLRENHVDGLIADCVDSKGLNQYIVDNSSFLPIVLVENNINDAFSGSFVSSNNYEMGKKISECIEKQAEVGIISGYTNRNSNMERLNGFKENFDADDQIRWVLQDTDQLMDYMKRFPIDTLIILENGVADEFMELVQNNILDELCRNMDIWVIGNSNKLVYYLDKEVIRGMVVPNEFGMGYAAVESVVNIINYNDVNDTEVSYTVITKENMYDSDIQRIIFPIVQ